MDHFAVIPTHRPNYNMMRLYSMRRSPINFILVGIAIAWLPANALAGPDLDKAAIEAAIPVPEPVNLPPPTIADLGPIAPAAEATTAAAPKDTVEAPSSGNLQAADQLVATKLRELLADQPRKFISREQDRAGTEAFYRDRDYAPLWTTDGSPNARASGAIAYLRGVAIDGLDPADYPIPDFSAASEPEARAKADLALTDSVLTFARHARTGRVHYTRVSGAILYELQYPEPAEVLSKLVASDNPAETLNSFNPQQPGYVALKAKLAEERARSSEQSEAVVRVPAGPVLRPGMEDIRVPILRKRLKVADDPDSLRYDETVVDAVKGFQREAGLLPDGLLGSNTLARLNGANASARLDVVDTIVANMERWRWLPRDLGAKHVMLNIPDYTLAVYDQGKTVWSTRVVVGKPGRMSTPLLSETIKSITVNPTWNVPPSIIHNEYLPALRQDPGALERIGLKVVQNANGTIRIYQPPGAGNALGRIRFNFPNKFLVYQHDTPDKHLFAHPKRAYSHGCMRVQDPDKYAEVLLSLTQPTDGYSSDRIRGMYGKGERNIALGHPMPVHLTYQTAYVDAAGDLQLRPDIYGRDAQTLAVLKNGERPNADTPVARRNSSAKPVVARLPARQQQGGFFSFFFQ
ncbi:MAG: L,D-transpeptidase family protein [Bradyrhizobium sp.]|nr:L,D-transpeptidase family protein [Bradyrhizobium sp.]